MTPTPDNTRDTNGRAPFQGHPAWRVRAADHVFEALSRAILSGEIKPGSVLATQRELSSQFAVSQLVAREATHRLEELGLVSVRQGIATTVCDPATVADVRLLQLQLKLATPKDRLALAARESEALSMLAIVVLAKRRITEPELQQLEALVDALPAHEATRVPLGFRVQFWTILARATHNAMLEQQVRWWASVMQELESRNGADPTRMERVALKPLYRKLLQALRRGRGAPEYWLKMIEKLWEWTEAQPAHAWNQRSLPGKRSPKRAASPPTAAGRRSQHKASGPKRSART